MFKRKNPSIGVNPAKTPRNAYDLSERSLYTQAPGMLLPVFVKEMNPDEKINLDISSQLQAMTLKGRAFSNMQQQFAAYFVPYRSLWSYWDSFITGLSLSNTAGSSSLQLNTGGSSLTAPCFRPFSLLIDNYEKTDSLGFPFRENFCRFCDLLEYGNIVYPRGPLPANDGNLATLRNYKANAFRWLAYQKIYQDHFLDDRFEKRNIKTYNVDYLGTDAPIVSDVECFQVRYAKYNKDLLTNIQPSPLFVSDVDNKIKSFVGNSALSLSSDDTVLKNTSWSSDSAFVSASTIRNLFALDKMAQISSRAAKTYRAQMLAHYGVNVSDAGRSSLYCGGFSRDLDTTSVIATADGKADDSSTNFGQQGGFIDSVNAGHIEFDSKGEFGVFMVLSWISPSLIWDADGISEFNCKFSKEDYFHPEFADLGMQPLKTNYLNNVRVASGVFGNRDTANIKNIMTIKPIGGDVYGWTERYAEYKSSYDRCHGEFKKFSVNTEIFDVGPIGSLSFLTHHVRAKSVIAAQGGGFFPSTEHVSLDTISIRPDVLDDVVEVAYKGHQYEDPFRVHSFFRCSMIRNMSVSGLPRINS